MALPKTTKAQRTQAETLLKQGLGNREVCRLTGVPYGSVRRMRENLGIEPHHSVGITGLPDLVEFLKAAGHDVEAMPFAHRFDLLIDGQRCEVKCAELGHNTTTGRGYYTFSLAGSASGARDNDFVTVIDGVAYKDYSKTCEFVILGGFKDGRLLCIYKVPSDAIKYGRRTLKIYPSHQKYGMSLWYDTQAIDAIAT